MHLLYYKFKINPNSQLYYCRLFRKMGIFMLQSMAR
jgi:hypothetical protein